MRLRLDEPRAANWPTGVVLAPFRPADAPEALRVLIDAYHDGYAGAFEGGDDWYARVSRDDEWDPALVLLARDVETQRIVGVCHGWTSAFLKDVCVARVARGQGLGEALVLSLAESYRQRGFSAMDLKVLPGNAPARGLYAKMGFQEA
ncbi:N-acetyltransferase [Aureimonas sp. AU4]|uniref:GNAT family N-acetyltransferase n=1 Tax=Aureimonas sp. AU4 TaxID=1638163 RepID=UPI0007829018|nr:GNAT family N-acetyltransferase [Aureimonas sp. AU4]